MFTALLIGGLALLLLKHKQRVEGIGRVKRRIYKEVSLAQNAGVDFSKKFTELTNDEIKALEQLGEKMTWKQSPRSAAAGKPYAESYYNSLRRAWNAVSGVSGIGAAYNVKDANGKVVLTWIEDAAEHYAAEERLNQMEAELRKKRNSIRRRRNAPLPAPTTELVVEKSKQQQLLDKFPYLRIMDDPRNPIKDSAAFTLVLWKTAKDASGNKIYEGPAMAFNNRNAAEDAKRFLKNDVWSMQTPEWSDFVEKLREDGRLWKRTADESSLTVKDVSKINLDKIAGIGRISIKNLIERDLLDYIAENIDEEEISETLDEIAETREPLYRVNGDLQGRIADLVNDWCTDNAVLPDSIFSVVDEEDILWAL